MAKRPNSRRNLDIAIERVAGRGPAFVQARTLMADAVVAQMLPDGAVKGGSALKLRFGDAGTRFSEDLDTARASGIDEYYCDPMKSGQKGSCEKNHVELRKVIPKGSSFAKLTPAKLSVVCSHVNSYGRPQFGGASPLQLASQVVPAELLDGLSIGLVPVEEVMMKPGLIEL